MTLDRSRTKMESLRHIVRLQTRRIEPLLERRRLPAVAEGIATPNAAQRGHFIETRATARARGQPRIGSYGDIDDVLGRAKVRGNFETRCRSQLVVGIQGRGVTSAATLLLEDLLAST